MKLMVAVVGLCLASAAPAVAVTAQAPQPLAISLSGDGARATRLPAYDPEIPIAIAATDSGKAAIDALTVVASGPSGQSLTVPLQRAGGGVFTGSLSLHDQGTWQLQLASRNGTLTTKTTPVSVDVAAPPPSNAAYVGLAAGAGLFVVVGGGGFFILRRALRSPAPAIELEEAA